MPPVTPPPSGFYTYVLCSKYLQLCYTVLLSDLINYAYIVIHLCSKLCDKYVAFTFFPLLFCSRVLHANNLTHLKFVILHCGQILMFLYFAVQCNLKLFDISKFF